MPEVKYLLLALVLVGCVADPAADPYPCKQREADVAEMTKLLNSCTASLNKSTTMIQAVIAHHRCWEEGEEP